MEERRPRVLHIGDYWNGGGAEKVLRDTVEASEILGNVNEVFTGDNIRSGPLSYVFSLCTVVKASAVLQRFRPDVIHLQNFYHRLSPSVLWTLSRYKRKFPNTKIVFTAHDMHLVCPNSGFQYFTSGEAHNISISDASINIFRRYDQRGLAYSSLKIMQHIVAYKLLKLYRHIDVVITPSHFLKNLLKAHHKELSYEVIRNPINQGGATASNYRRWADSNQIKIVFFGRVSKEKGLSEFIRLCLPLFENENISLDIFGDGPEKSALQSLAASCNLTSQIRFMGQISADHVQSAMKNYSLLVLPSTWYENAPLVICEAAAAGLPVLVRSSGGAEELAGEVRWGISSDLSNVESTWADIKLLASHAGQNELLEPNQFSEANYASQLSKTYHRA